jgi:hypothetical protein
MSLKRGYGYGSRQKLGCLLKSKAMEDDLTEGTLEPSEYATNTADYGRACMGSLTSYVLPR